MRKSDFEILHGFATSQGKVRAKNEDSFGFVKNSVYFVADGAGGLPGGEVASKFVCDLLPKYLKENKGKTLKEKVDYSIRKIHKEIRRYGVTHFGHLGLCSTVAILGFDKDKILIENVGDSIVYEVKRNEIEKVSKVQALLGYVLTHAVGVRIGKVFPNKYILRGAGKTFVLCTDGLIKMLSDEEIFSKVSARKLSSSKDCEMTAKDLVDEADKRGGVDNTTVGIVKII